MNAIRQILISDATGTVHIEVPRELREKPVEVIVMPIDDSNGSFDLLTIMDYIGYKVRQRGLTSEDLDKLLRED